ncbi:MAG: type II toxin-antitoxin system RelE/ParE family toxin [Spirochaetia bacterium]|nr:type II toxin-antitoxin system RelE/ParE family toxin [Spirochaetia bacterium]
MNYFQLKHILEAIQALAENPRPSPPQSKKLSGHDRYRLRQGNFRILYSIEDEKLIVCVVKVGNRREVYRN